MHAITLGLMSGFFSFCELILSFMLATIVFLKSLSTFLNRFPFLRTDSTIFSNLMVSFPLSPSEINNSKSIGNEK